MYDETNVPGPEYRVRTVVRHIVTQYCHPFVFRGDGTNPPREEPSGSTVIGEFANAEMALDVAKAMSHAHPGSTVST